MTTKFGRLRQKWPEVDQPVLPVVEFTLTNHVHLSLTCGKAGWGRAYRTVNEAHEMESHDKVV
jgi:hypothetical protein